MSEPVKQPELKQHDSSVLDLAFVMDCTGSMGSYIDNARNSIKKIVEEIVSLEKSDVRLALVEYRDHPPQETSFETRVHDFTESIKSMREWLEECSAQGGGDEPECVAEGLHEALKLTWRDQATKICVLVSDAPPHGINCPSDTFPNGSPNGIDPIETVDKMAEKGVTLYSVGCEPAILPYKEFFSSLAFKTGGQYVPLRNATLLAKVIVGGAVEEISLEKLMAEVEQEIQEKTKEGITDERLLSEAVETRFKSRGVTTNQIFLNNANLEKASDNAKKYSKIKSLSHFKEEFKPDVGSFGYSTAYSAPRTAMRESMRAAAFGAPLAMAMGTSDVLFSTPAPVSSEPVVETVSYGKSEISYAQSERLVQKALNRSKQSHK